MPISLSAQLRNVGRIDGFDVSGAQFPPREWLPHNVHLYVQDVFAPFAEEFVGVYDVVHVRFFMTLVVDTEALGPLIRNLMTLLSMCIFLSFFFFFHLSWASCYIYIYYSRIKGALLGPSGLGVYKDLFVPAKLKLNLCVP